MLSDLFINAVILIAVLSVGTQIFKEKPLNSTNTVSAKILAGVMLGLLGCILMKYTVHINSKVILDFRNIPILFAAVSSGFISSVVAAAVIGVFRCLYFGISNASAVGLFIAMAIGIGCGLICKANLSQKKKWTYCVIYALIAATIGFMINIKDAAQLINILFYYYTASILMSVFIYFYTQYLQESGALYRRYRDEVRMDFLTGLNNVRQFDIVLNDMVNQIKMDSNKSLSLLYMDIDFFKKINDTYGHAEGDKVLKDFSKLLTSSFNGSELVFRNGGEEFSILMPGCTAASAIYKAESLRKAVQDNVFRLSNGSQLSVTASIGVSSYPERTKDIDKLLEEADNALYVAKRSGRNKSVLYGNKMM